MIDLKHLNSRKVHATTGNPVWLTINIRMYPCEIISFDTTEVLTSDLQIQDGSEVGDCWNILPYCQSKPIFGLGKGW